MAIQIQKRTGEVVAFNPEKIRSAIAKANRAVGDEPMYDAAMDALTARVCAAFADQDTPTVEQIQDSVEEHLIAAGYARTAKAYILYRAEHTRLREAENNLMHIYQDLTYRAARDVDIKRENANIDTDTAMGTMLKYGSEGSKYFVNNYVLPKDIAAAHVSGDIHIHDQDFYMLTQTCCQIDLLKLFDGGFCTGHGFLREPNDITSYTALACIALQANQNEMHGGQGIPNFDYAMAPGVAKTYTRLYYAALAQYLQITLGMEADAALALAAQARSGIKTPVRMGDDTHFPTALQRFFAQRPAGADPAPDAQRLAAAHAYAAQTALRQTDRTTFQAMEALIHNLNTMHSRAGAQVPFSSLNYGTDTSPEARMAIKNLLLATKAGLGEGETPIFPVQIFKVKEGINYNPSDPNYDLFQLACKTSAKRLFPNFSFLDAPFNLQYYTPGDYDTEVAYMGCRTRVMGNTYDPQRQTTSGRGNLSFTSINLPRLAIRAQRDLDAFYKLLDDTIDLVERQLLHRFAVQCAKHVYNYPFLMGQGVWIDADKLGTNDSIADILRHGTLSVGFIGLAETLVALTGQHHGQSEQSQQLGLAIVDHMRKRMDELAEKHTLNFSLLATPAEGLSGRFVKIDARRFGVIPGITDREYYTNSFHVPVYYPIRSYDKIRIEAPYHALTNAGHISYVELDGDVSDNMEAFETIIRCMKEAGVGYGSINHPVDRDSVCGYNGIIQNECPRCHRAEGDGPAFERIRRITGYLVGTTDRWNNAKRAEEHDRVKHGL